MAQQPSSPMIQNASPTYSSVPEEVSAFLALPPELLQAKVSRLPLRHLLPTLPTLPPVHPRLSTCRKVALQATSHLELFIGNQKEIQRILPFSSGRLPCSRFLVDSGTGKPLYPYTGDFNRLHLSTLESPTVDTLISLMPGISHLTVRLYQVDILVLPELIRLLTSWASTLKSLIFSCKITPSHEWVLLPPLVRQRDQTVYSYMILRVISAINDHLMVLEHLRLDIYERLFQRPLDGLPAGEPPSFPVQIICRLKEFTLKAADELRDFNFDALHASIGAESPLQAVELSFIDAHWSAFLECIPPGSPLASRIVALPYMEAPWPVNQGLPLAPWPDPELRQRIRQVIGEDNLHQLFGRDGPPPPVENRMQRHLNLLGAYPNLRVVDLILDAERPFSAYLGVLSSLKQLQAVKLTMDDSQALKLEALQGLPQAPLTVSVLKLRHRYYQHTDLLFPLWATLFPSVQIVLLQRIHSAQFCTICYPDADREFLDQIPEQYEAVMPCLKQLIAPLIVLPALRKIFYQQDNEHDNTVEFSSTGDFVQTHTEDIY